jgi:flagellar motor protein MotB
MSAEIDENTTVEDVAIEEMKFTKGPSKKDIEEIEKEFQDILENDETSADDSRFTEQEMQQIDTIWKYIQRQTKTKKQEKEMKELEALTANEYLATYDDSYVEDEFEDTPVEEVSFEDLNNFEESELYYND